MLSQVACPACGAGNRLDGRSNVAGGKCGACGASLMLAEPIDVDDAAFAAHLKNTRGPVVVDIWAPWCGPCRLMAPNFEGAAAQLAGKARFLKLNADKSDAANRLGVRGIPSLILFENGREVARQAGPISKEGMVAWVQANAAAPTTVS